MNKENAMTRRFVLKFPAIATLALFLTGCAASFDHAIKEDGSAIALVSVQTVADFEPSVWLGPISQIYLFSPLFDEDDNTFTGNRKAIDQSSDRRARWIAYVLPPGTYSVVGVLDRAETRDGAILFGPPPTRITNFADAGGPLAYQLGAGEIVYIGTFQSSVTTRETRPIGRRFVEAQKSYLLQTDEAKRMIEKFKLPEATFKQVDLFEGRPEALALYERPITTIPISD